MFRVYKYVKYQTTDDDIVVDENTLLGIAADEGILLNIINNEMNRYIDISRNIKTWFDCDFHIEQRKDANDKWHYLQVVECEIDNEKRTITINNPVEYQMKEIA